MNLKQVLTACCLAFALWATPAMASDMVNINTASVEELQSLNGVGEKTAAAIVAYREMHGKFKSADDLTQVKGIGDKSLDKIRDQVSVE